ncbi:hypothetical protein RFI_14851 [Reticulomyxa filosa]|uniref:IBB domain-containing protein n=1 Tax=Reticulomyxa filosa TaxID=46433 RepID=X6N8X5_RETFI|nr:hypothetical protein RFI_14851 [Reticulomyxa filosa]|eukprot:ETO22348.1 hypothetical protein RFI_14851 [Reticulomyxa filosa]
MFPKTQDTRRDFSKGLEHNTLRRKRQEERWDLRKIDEGQRTKTEGGRKQEEKKTKDGGRSQSDEKRKAIEMVIRKCETQLQSKDESEHWTGAHGIRQLLSTAEEEEESSLECIWDSTIVPRLLVLLKDCSKTKLQYECVWSVAHIASGPSAWTAQVCKLGAIQALLHVLAHSTDNSIIDMVVWGLANITSDCAQYRDHILQTNVLEFILENILLVPINVQDSFVWALGNLTRGSVHIALHGYNDERQMQCHLKRLLAMIDPLAQLYKDITTKLTAAATATATATVIDTEIGPSVHGNNNNNNKDNDVDICYSILVEITYILWFISDHEHHLASFVSSSSSSSSSLSSLSLISSSSSPSSSASPSSSSSLSSASFAITKNDVVGCCCNDEDVVQLIIDTNLLSSMFQHLAKAEHCPTALLSASVRLFGQISAGFVSLQQYNNSNLYKYIHIYIFFFLYIRIRISFL